MMRIYCSAKNSILASLIVVAALVAYAGKTYAELAVKSTISFDHFVEIVKKNHPEGAINRKMLGQAKEAENRSGLLPDPRFTIGRDNAPFPHRLQMEPVESMAEDAAEWRIGLSQSFPWPGTLAAEQKATRAQSNTTETKVSLAELERSFAAKELFLRLVRTAKTIDIQSANLKVVRGFRDFSHARFEQGIGDHMEFLQTQSESAVLKTNLVSLETDLRNIKRHALLQMNAPDRTDPDTVDFLLEWPEDLIKPSSHENQGSDIIRDGIVRSKEAELAKKDAEYRRSLPSFMASGMVMQEDSGMKMYGAMLGVTLPLYSRVQRQSISSEAALVESRANDELAWHERRKALALEQAHARIAQIEANVKALRDEIIPAVKEHVEAATVKYSHGKGSVNIIIDGRRTLLNLETAELAMIDALARARLSVQKIQGGLIDDEINVPVPQLSVATGSSMPTSDGMSNMGGANSAPAGKGDMPMTGGKAGKKTLKGIDQEESGDEGPKGDMSGM